MTALKELYNFFNHPFFVIVGGIATLVMIVTFFYSIILVIRGVFPVWYRLGKGLSKREIAIFENDEFDSLKCILVDSRIFKEKNIIKIEQNYIKKAESISLLLLHWKAFKDNIDNVLSIKKDSDALIIYAPQEEGLIDKSILTKINQERNCIVVNLRGRLLNDILSSMITTSYSS